LPRLPEANAPVACGERLSAHSCGGSCGIGRCWPSPHSLWSLAGTDDALTITQLPAAATRSGVIFAARTVPGERHRNAVLPYYATAPIPRKRPAMNLATYLETVGILAD